MTPDTRPEAAPGAVACAACGAPFVCGLRAGAGACWCAQLPALEPVPGRDCLCRACLETALAQARPQST